MKYLSFIIYLSIALIVYLGVQIVVGQAIYETFSPETGFGILFFFIMWQVLSNTVGFGLGKLCNKVFN